MYRCAPTPFVTASVLAACVAACGGAAPPAAQTPSSSAAAPAARAQSATPQPTGDEPQCVTWCSTSKLRTVVASVSWPLAQPAGSPQTLSAGIAADHLDVTTFKDGFSRGVFAQLSQVRASQPFGLAPAATQNDIPSLSGLSVTRVTTLQERIASGAPNAHAGIMPPSAGNDPNRVVVVEIEGLEPGLNYFWRRTPDGPIARCQAPTCPADQRGPR